MNTTTRSINHEIRSRNFSQDVTRPRERTQESAQRLSLIAMRNWEKALTGVIALPAAAALSTAATVLFAASLVERAFGMFESTISDMGRRVGEEFDAHGDLRDEWRREERDGQAQRAS